MTRGRRSNVAHMVADSVDDARQQWIEVFNRHRADLGPGHAATRVEEDIERHGTEGSTWSEVLQVCVVAERRRGPVSSMGGSPGHRGIGR